METRDPHFRSLHRGKRRGFVSKSGTRGTRRARCGRATIGASVQRFAGALEGGGAQSGAKDCERRGRGVHTGCDTRCVSCASHQFKTVSRDRIVSWDKMQAPSPGSHRVCHDALYSQCNLMEFGSLRSDSHRMRHWTLHHDPASEGKGPEVRRRGGGFPG